MQRIMLSSDEARFLLKLHLSKMTIKEVENLVRIHLQSGQDPQAKESGSSIVKHSEFAVADQQSGEGDLAEELESQEI